LSIWTHAVNKERRAWKGKVWLLKKFITSIIYPPQRHTHTDTHTAASKKSSRISFQSRDLSFPPSLLYLTLSQSHAHPLTPLPFLLSLCCTFYRLLSLSLLFPLSLSLSPSACFSHTLLAVYLPRSESFTVGM